MEEKRITKRIVFMMCMIGITLSSLFIIGKANPTYALDQINGYRYHTTTCEKYYITVCNTTMCNFTSINGKSWSGSISRNKLRLGVCDSSPTEYRVSFDLNGGAGSAVDQFVSSGGKASRPSNPKKNGYTFVCWTLNGNEYNFNSPVRKSITLTAKWRENTVQKYTVTFNSNGGSSVPSQTIESGKTASRPSNPTKNGYTFTGWYTSSGSAYNFNSGVTSNITLYAHWQENAKPTPTPTPATPSTPAPTTPSTPSNPTTPSTTYYKVKFDLNGGSGEIAEQNIEKNGKASKPATEPTKSNTTFKGWYTSNDCKSEFNFDTKITKETTIYACYVNSYNVNIIKTGLPYANTETKKFKEGSNLQEYNQNSKITIFDVTTYSMLDKDACSDYLSDIRKKETAIERCNNIDNTLKCSGENCYSGKYLVLDESKSEEIVYLKTNGIIKIEYEVYNYNGLFRDRTCKDKYSYSNKITSNIEVYACYVKEGDTSVTPNIEPTEKSNGGKVATLVLIVLAILAVVGVVFYFVRKAKIANSVD